MTALPTRDRAAIAVGTFFCLALAGGCSGGAPQEQRREEPQSRRAGRIEGLVRLAGGPVPPPTQVENTTDPAVCGRTHTLQDLLVSDRTRGVRNTIVALDAGTAGALPPAPPRRLVLDNVGCQFSPHASVLTVGSVIEATNSDPTLHTVHFYGPLDANLALPVKGMRVTRTVERPGTIVVKCDVHGWMQAFIRVDPHPFHAVTDASGAFRIEGAPPGQYTLEAWHERLGRQQRTLLVKAGETVRITIEYAAAGE